MGHFPFTAIVGQDDMKMALILNAINPLLGGVLICGQKGTAKSTTVRSLASCLPEICVVKGCRFRCDPQDTEALCDDCRRKVEKDEHLPSIWTRMSVIDLPLGATEDRVLGTLDIEQAIKKGERHFQPGILAEANRGMLYVDEVNLLDDHLVDILLDVAASGVNIVEREGISFSHPAQLILVGTMNPEEGELRPQLLDRFGLCVYVQGLNSIEDRSAVIQRRLDFEADSSGFVNLWKDKETGLMNSILNARKLLPEVMCPEELYKLAAQVSLDYGVDGHRTDILLIKTAKTIAALGGNTRITEDEVQKAGYLVLPHRMKKNPCQSKEDERGDLQNSLKTPVVEESHTCVSDEACSQSTSDIQKRQGQEYSEAIFAAEKPYTVRRLSVVPKKIEQPRDGRRSTVEGNLGSGKQIGSKIFQKPSMEIAFDATCRAAAPYQTQRDRGSLAIAIEYPDLREKRKHKRIAHTILFLVDASGSMGADQQMVQTKGAILSLLKDAYKRRDRVGMVTFNQHEARVVLAPTSDKEKAKRALQKLPVGGKTPLSKGLSVAYEALKKYSLKMKNEVILLVVISDGKANVTMKRTHSLEEAKKELVTRYHSTNQCGLPSLYDLVSSQALQEAMEVAEEIKRSGIKSVVIDTAKTGRRGHLEKLCSCLGGLYFKMEELQAEGLVHIVSASLNRLHTLSAPRPQ